MPLIDDIGHPVGFIVNAIPLDLLTYSGTDCIKFYCRGAAVHVHSSTYLAVPYCTMLDIPLDSLYHAAHR